VRLARKIVQSAVIQHLATSVSRDTDSFQVQLPNANSALQPIARLAMLIWTSAVLARLGTTLKSALAHAQNVRVTIVCRVEQISSVRRVCQGTSLILSLAHVQHARERTA